MTNSDKEAWPFCCTPWQDQEYILSLAENTALPAKCFFPEDGIPQRDPDRYYDYRLDLMLEAEAALRSILGMLVDFRQCRKLTQFLLGLCDLLEITYDKNTGNLKECRFRIDFSDRVSILYSSRMCGCILLLDEKQDSVHSISPQAIDDLRQILADIWERIRDIHGWEIIKQKDQLVTVQHRPTLN